MKSLLLAVLLSFPAYAFARPIDAFEFPIEQFSLARFFEDYPFDLYFISEEGPELHTTSHFRDLWVPGEVPAKISFAGFSQSTGELLGQIETFSGAVYHTRGTPYATPEPTSLLLVGIGVATLWRKRRAE